MALPGTRFGKSTGGAAPVATDTTSNTTATSVAPAGTAPRRFGFRKLGSEATAEMTAGAPAVAMTGKQLLSGEYHAFVSGLETGDKAGITFAVHAPGTKEHGTEFTLYLSSKNEKARKFHNERILKFFKESGFPEGQMRRDDQGRSVLPILDLFTHAVEVEGGERLVFPAMLLAKFTLRQDPNDASKSYQEIESAKKLDNIAPLPGFFSKAYADALGWRCVSGERKDGGWWYRIDERSMIEISECYGKAFHGVALGDGIEDIIF